MDNTTQLLAMTVPMLGTIAVVAFAAVFGWLERRRRARADAIVDALFADARRVPTGHPHFPPPWESASDG